MSAMRDALIAAGIEPDRPKPSETFECLKVRVQYSAPFSNRMFTDTHKWCPRCQRWLMLDWFPPSRHHASGRHTYCRPCRAEYDRQYQQRKRAA